LHRRISLQGVLFLTHSRYREIPAKSLDNPKWVWKIAPKSQES